LTSEFLALEVEQWIERATKGNVSDLFGWVVEKKASGDQRNGMIGWTASRDQERGVIGIARHVSSRL